MALPERVYRTPLPRLLGLAIAYLCGDASVRDTAYLAIAEREFLDAVLVHPATGKPAKSARFGAVESAVVASLPAVRAPLDVTSADGVRILGHFYVVRSGANFYQLRAVYSPSDAATAEPRLRSIVEKATFTASAAR